MYKPKSIITRKYARDMFALLTQELEAMNQLNDRTIMIVDNMVLLEQIKGALVDDIRKRGAVELFKNGSQEMYRQNKSVSEIAKIVEQQRKLQAELKLTPASEKRVAKAVEGDDFSGY